MRTRLHKSEHLVFKYLLLTAEFYNIELPANIITTYAPTLNNSAREQFLDYLHCIYHKKYFAKTHWQNIREIKSFAKQVRYFLELIFPPKEFMIAKYLQNQESRTKSKEQRTKNKEQRIKSQEPRAKNQDRKKLSNFNYQLSIKFWWLWYGYRWFVGLKGVLLLLRKKG